MTTKLVVRPMPAWNVVLMIGPDQDAAERRLQDGIRGICDWGSLGWQTAQREAALGDELAEALEMASDTIRSFDGLIGYGPDCDEKIARFEELVARHKEARNG